jgi:hypothetical protein
VDSGTDSRGNRYLEFDMTDAERIRVTRIAQADWAGGPTLRVQKRRKTGNVVQGPEFPVSVSSQLIEALRSLTD